MASSGIRHKHLRLNQAKLDRVKAALGVATETEALERAMDTVLAEEAILKALRRVRGKGRIERLFS
jgi:hypothetical protein